MRGDDTHGACLSSDGDRWKTYFAGKVFEINYRMAIHEGDANRRLASEAIKILLLPLAAVPSRYRKQFDKLRRLVEETVKDLPEPGLTPTRLRGIHNGTAAKYIKLLLDIQDAVSDI